MTGYESWLEYALHKLARLNLNVADLEEQPETFTFEHKGKVRSYTPDLLLTFQPQLVAMLGWRPLFLEVKWRRDLLRKWFELKPKLIAARSQARERECDFVLITDGEINRPYLANAVFLLEFRKLPHNELDENLILEVLKTEGQINPETLMRHLTSDPFRRSELLQSLWHLVADFRVIAPLEERLTMRSLISTTEDKEDSGDEYFHGHRTGRARELRWRAIRHYPYPDS
jgi:hypothetical protein